MLLRYSLVQRVDGAWPGIRMHNLVQWRAMQSGQSRPWRWWYTVFISAACYQITLEGNERWFRSDLTVHLPDIEELSYDGSKDVERRKVLPWICYDKGWCDDGHS